MESFLSRVTDQFLQCPEIHYLLGLEDTPCHLQLSCPRWELPWDTIAIIITPQPPPPSSLPTFTWCSLYTWHYYLNFVNSYPLNLHKHKSYSWYYIYILPFYRPENWGKERWSDLTIIPLSYGSELGFKPKYVASWTPFLNPVQVRQLGASQEHSSGDRSPGFQSGSATY